MRHRSRPCRPATVALAAAAMTLSGMQGLAPAEASRPVAGSASAGLAQAAGPAVDLVKDIWPGRLPSRPAYIVDLGGVAYFAAATRDSSDELWRSDGTEGGTWSLGTVGPEELTPAGDLVFFRALGDTGLELWRTDGTALGTTALTSTPTPPGGSEDPPEELTAAGGRLFFARGDGDGSDVELWTSDGTAQGTRRVADLRPGPESSYPRDLVAVGDDVYFTAYDSLHGRELWRSDGTALGTVRVADVDPRVDPNPVTTASGPSELTAVGGRVFFVADDAVHGRELWTSDGTPLGTHLVLDVSERSGTGSQVGELTAFGDRVFFMAQGETADRVLWISDGTAEGTRQLSEVGPGSYSSWSTVMGDHLYFNAMDDRGHELWRSDGTPAGTTLVADIDPVPAEPSTYPVGSHPTQLTAVGDELFFLASDRTHGRSLWSSDGTAGGTVLVEDVEPVAPDFDEVATNLAVVGDDLFLTVADNAHGAELWSTAAPSAALPAVVVEAAPSVVGAPALGETVSADPGAWSPSAPSFAYQWFADGHPLDATGATLTPDASLVGDVLRVLVTASSPGHRTRSALSEATSPVTGAVRNEVRPEVVGTARVGGTLRARGSVWSPAYASLSYEWFVSGVRRPVGHGHVLRVPASAVGRRLVVRVTGAVTDWDSSSAVSAATARVKPATFTLGRGPELAGRARVGSVLRVSTGSVTPAAARTRVRWLRDGRVVAAATGSTYRLRAADRGARISARVTWTRQGYRSFARTTRATSAVR